MVAEIALGRLTGARSSAKVSSLVTAIPASARKNRKQLLRGLGR